MRVPEVKEATALGCAIAAGAGAGLFADMATTGERLVKWSREFTPNPQHRALYDGMMQKWQAVYADQLGLVDSGLTTSMGKRRGWCEHPLTPALSLREREIESLSLWERVR